MEEFQISKVKCHAWSGQAKEAEALAAAEIKPAKLKGKLYRKNDKPSGLNFLFIEK